ADLRRAFSGIVAGNVKEVGIRAIEANGPYKIHGDREMMRRMDFDVPVNAQYIRNIILAAHTTHDHIVHFYQLSALDWVDITYAL
ncbi:DUF3412 domain-containing protein, partial [Salmonella enterica subsp. enterica serovar Anatum]|nr:DUF3412 domain-containing protein [Salmonella enterica subsp. enterica serovar Anatum]